MPDALITVDASDWTSGIKNWSLRVEKGIKEGLAFSVKSGFNVSQQRCPVLTGNLKRSGRVEQKGDYVYQIRYEAPYAYFVENGTSRMRSQPFLKPGFDEIERTLLSAIKERVGF
jgi:HK97 gp10 family phage protein